MTGRKQPKGQRYSGQQPQQQQQQQQQSPYKGRATNARQPRSPGQGFSSSSPSEGQAVQAQTTATKTMYIFAHLIGQKVEAHLDDGSVYMGVFNSFTKEAGSFGVVLKCAYKLEGQEKSFSKAIETFVVEPNRIVQLIAAKFRFESAQASSSSGASDGFMTDTDISRQEFRERELTPWDAGADFVTNDMVSLNEEVSTWSSWDQFRENERKFGVKTTYDERYYTTPLNRDSEDYKRLEKEAEKKAEEILKDTSTTNVQHALERGLVSDTHDEEELFGSVIRDDTPKTAAGQKTGSSPYVPPYKRPSQKDEPKVSVSVSTPTPVPTPTPVAVSVPVQVTVSATPAPTPISITAPSHITLARPPSPIQISTPITISTPTPTPITITAPTSNTTMIGGVSITTRSGIVIRRPESGDVITPGKGGITVTSSPTASPSVSRPITISSPTTQPQSTDNKTQSPIVITKPTSQPASPTVTVKSPTTVQKPRDPKARTQPPKKPTIKSSIIETYCDAFKKSKENKNSASSAPSTSWGPAGNFSYEMADEEYMDGFGNSGSRAAPPYGYGAPQMSYNPGVYYPMQQPNVYMMVGRQGQPMMYPSTYMPYPGFYPDQ